MGNHSTPFIFDSMGKGKLWKYFGVFGIFTNIAIVSYYCYIESWTLAYLYHSIAGTFNGMSQAQVAQFFSDYVDVRKSTSGLPGEAVIFYVVCLVINIYILSRGLSGGVEKAARIGMPLLLLFGAGLAVVGLTMGTSQGYAGCTDCDSSLGLNYLWMPDYSSIWSFKVWLAAAGQIFFTLSVGMGTIHCYAAYVRHKDDIALNAMTAGWMNTFVEVVLGASVVIPISVGFLGLDWALENAGFAMGFQTMPYLFSQWGLSAGQVVAVLAAIAWFGLLFFAGITSSLAMGTPWMGFMQDEFRWSRHKAAWTFGLVTLAAGLPTVFFFQEGVFDEYDFWGGTVSLVLFALGEIIIFSWIFGINRSWEELRSGADMRVPDFYKFITKYITPIFILLVFVGALITPKDNNWSGLLKGEFELSESSIIGKVLNKGVVANRDYFANHLESDVAGTVSAVKVQDGTVAIDVSRSVTFYRNEKGKLRPAPAQLPPGTATRDSTVVVKTLRTAAPDVPTVKVGDPVQPGTVVAQGKARVNPIFYTSMSRLLLMLIFIGICFLVYKAHANRQKRLNL
jgi:SNF family Na+-dependent transporter